MACRVLPAQVLSITRLAIRVTARSAFLIRQSVLPNAPFLMFLLAPPLSTRARRRRNALVDGYWKPFMEGIRLIRVASPFVPPPSTLFLFLFRYANRTMGFAKAFREGPRITYADREPAWLTPLLIRLTRRSIPAILPAAIMITAVESIASTALRRRIPR